MKSIPIDHHAHLYHPRWYPPAFQAGLTADIARRTGKDARTAQGLTRILADRTGETTVRIMDKAGLQQKVILILDWGVELGEAEASIHEIHTEILGACARFPDRLIGFTGVDPRRDDAVSIVTRACDDLGARGLKLHPTGGWTLTEPRTLALVSVAAQRGLPVLVHVGRTMAILSDRNAQPHDFVRLAREFPGIPFIAGHSGFERYTDFIGMPDVPPNVHFDISGWQEMAADPSRSAKADFARLVAAFPNRVCFGTDSPFYSYNLPATEERWIRTILEWVEELPESIRPNARSLAQASVNSATATNPGPTHGCTPPG